MIEFVLDALAAAGIARTIVVIGYRADDVQADSGQSRRTSNSPCKPNDWAPATP